jgi:hypothetical protein
MIRVPISPNVFIQAGAGATLSGKYSGGVGATFRF